jgi:hypothetical protein
MAQEEWGGALEPQLSVSPGLTKLVESRILAWEVVYGKDDRSVETGEKKSGCKETLFIRPSACEKSNCLSVGATSSGAYLYRLRAGSSTATTTALR